MEINQVLELLSKNNNYEALEAVKRMQSENAAMRKLLIPLWEKQLKEV